MTKILAFSVLGIALLGGLAFLLLESGSEVEAPRRLSTKKDPEPKAKAEEKKDNRDLTSRVVALETSEFSGQDEDLEELAQAEREASQVYVIGPDGQPVAGATVRLLRWREEEEESPFGGQRWMQAEAPVAAYREVATNEDGLAALSPLPRRRFRIEARAGDLFGSTEFIQGREPGAEAVAVEAEALIRLAPIKVLSVLVQDSAGSPLGDVRVQAMPNGGAGGNPFGGRGGRGGGPARMVTAWTSPTDGRASIEITPDSGLYDLPQISVQAALAGHERLMETAELATAMRQEVVLRAPQSTAIAIELRTADGELFTDGASLSFAVDPASLSLEADGGNMFRNFFERSMIGSRWVTEGRTRLGGFHPGARIRFTVNVKGRVPATTSHKLSASSLEESLVVAVGAEQSFAIVAVQDASGQPIKDTLFRVALQYDREEFEEPVDGRSNDFDRMARRFQSMGEATRDMRTNAEGKLRIPVQPNDPGALELHPAGRGFGGRRGGRGGPPMFGGGEPEEPLAQLRFQGLPEGGDHELGALALKEQALLAGGRVLVGEKVPLAGARVTLRGNPIADPNADPADVRRNFFRGMRSEFTVTTDNSGQFAIYGRAEPDREWIIDARGDEHQSAPKVIIPGARNLELVAERDGGLVGSVRLAPDVQTRDLNLSLRAEDELQADRDRNLRLGRDLTFKADRLSPGRYTFRATVAGFEAVEIPGLVIKSGETLADSRLQDLLVGAEFQLAEVRVVDASGLPVARARVIFSTPEDSETVIVPGGGRQGRGGGRGGPQGFNAARTNDQGLAQRLVRRGDRIDVQVNADDGSMAKVERANFPLVVTLERGTDLALVFDPAFPGLDGVETFSLSLSTPEAEARGGGFFPGGGGGRGGRGQAGTFRAGATETSLKNVAPGTYTLRLFFRGPRAEGGPPSFGTLSLGEVTISRGELQKTQRLSVTTEMLQGAIQAFGAGR